jgi:hypothetical protein
LDEKLWFNWYATAGEFTQDTTGRERPDTVLSFEKPDRRPPADGKVDVWVVVHDERGGVDYTHRQIVVTPP